MNCYFHTLFVLLMLSALPCAFSSSSASVETYSVFGSLAHIGDYHGSISILIIVVIVLLLEHCIKVIKKYTDDTLFEEMIHAIENEMMIVGIMAFAFRIVFDANPHILDDNWHFAMEYSDMLIPITTFVFCIEGVVFVFMTMRQMNIWRTHYRIPLLKIYHDVFAKNHLQFFLKMSWAPLSNTLEGVEFRIVNHIFCDEYKISTDAFSFDEYCGSVAHDRLVELVELTPTDWAFVIFIIFLNWARTAAGIRFVDCHDGDINCASYAQITLFTACGYLMSIFICFLAVFFSHL